VTGNPRRPEFFAKAPFSDTARKDMIRLHGKNPDYMAGMSVERKASRAGEDELSGLSAERREDQSRRLAVLFGEGGRNNKRVDTMPALEAAEHGQAGFNGLGLKLEERFSEGSYLFHFPDGNASIARLLVNRLIPGAIPGQQSMNTIVQAQVAYEKLDEPTRPRIRLSSPVCRVQHDGDPDHSRGVRVAYLHDGKAHTRFAGGTAFWLAGTR
jgi:spermidine dehydrogenase